MPTVAPASAAPGAEPRRTAAADDRCPHCSSTRVAPFDAARTWTYEGEICTLRRCADCGGLFSHPLPSPALLATLYARDFNYAWYRDHQPAKLLDSLLRLSEYRRAGRLAGPRLLDYGGGLGYFARAARLWGYDARSCDPHVGEPSTRGAIAGAPFDTVVLHHVLEHARSPLELLAEVRGLLAPSGALIVAVPNATSLGYAKLGVDFVWGQPPFIHIHHFTPRGLGALLLRAGFAVTSEACFDRWDASTLADVWLAPAFRRIDGRWRSARWRWGAAQLDSALRFAALAASGLLPRPTRQGRSELLVVARLAEQAGRSEHGADGAAMRREGAP